jgi:hypothetical protein
MTQALKEAASSKGHVRIERFDSDGQLREVRECDNLIVQAGKNLLATALGAAITPFGWIAVGTNGTTPVLSNTTLGTELARVAVTSAAAVGPVTTFSASFLPGIGTGVWQEAGIFNAVSAGVMYSHVVFTAMTKNAGDTLVITWAITQL